MIGQLAPDSLLLLLIVEAHWLGSRLGSASNPRLLVMVHGNLHFPELSLLGKPLLFLQYSVLASRHDWSIKAINYKANSAWKCMISICKRESARSRP